MYYNSSSYSAYPSGMHNYMAPNRFVQPGMQDTMTQPFISESELNYRNQMRLIWEQHVYWTRMTILSLVFNLPDKNFVIATLLKNADDNGNIIRPYYGDRVADQYRQLIKYHLTLAADLVNAAIEGNAAKVESIDKKWHQNADMIVAFLSSINPYFPKEEFKNMFYRHLTLTKNEAVYMIQKQYQKSIDAFNQIELDALKMADMISTSIIMQFPNRFNAYVY